MKLSYGGSTSAQRPGFHVAGLIREVSGPYNARITAETAMPGAGFVNVNIN
jgi:hypothetical protein